MDTLLQIVSFDVAVTLHAVLLPEFELLCSVAPNQKCIALPGFAPGQGLEFTAWLALCFLFLCDRPVSALRTSQCCGGLVCPAGYFLHLF
jgi:hypothetical protein